MPYNAFAQVGDGAVEALNTNFSTVADNPNRVALACLFTQGGQAAHAVTLGGVSMGAPILTLGVENDFRIYLVTAPPTGTPALAATWTGVSPRCCLFGVIYDTIDQTTIYRDIDQFFAEGGAAGSTLNLTSVAGDTLVDFALCSGDTITPDVSQTRRVNLNDFAGTFNSAGASEKVATGTTTSMQWTAPTADEYVWHVALSLIPASGNSMNAVEGADTAAIVGELGELPISGTLAVTEGADTVQAQTVLITTTATLPGTGENNAGIGATAWTNPGTICLNNVSDATCNGASSQYLVGRNFPFAAAVPPSAHITGVTVVANASEHTTGSETFNARLQDEAGALVGTGKTASVNGTGKTNYSYGGAHDLWGAALTRAIIIDADFGVRFWFTTNHDVRVEHVTMAITYAPYSVGTLAATEGADTVAISGNLAPEDIEGTLAVTEAADVVAIVADTGLEGVLAATEAADTAAIAAELGRIGTFAATEGADSIAITGATHRNASLAVTEGADSAAISADVYIGAVLAATEAADTLAASGEVSSAASLAVTEGADTAAISATALSYIVILTSVNTTAANRITALPDLAAGDWLEISDPIGGPIYEVNVNLDATFDVHQDITSFLVRAYDGTWSEYERQFIGNGNEVQLDVTEGSDTAAISALMARVGTVNAIEAQDTAAISGDVLIEGLLAAVEGMDSASASGQVSVSGSLAAVEAGDTASIDVEVKVTGSMAATEGGDTALINAGLNVIGSFSATEAADSFAAEADVLIEGFLAANEGSDAFVATSSTERTGSLNVTEAADTFAAVILRHIVGNLAALEAADGVSINADVLVTGNVAAMDGGDSVAVSGQVQVTGSAAANESGDSLAALGLVLVSGSVDALEGADSFSGGGAAPIAGSLAVTEEPDTVLFSYLPSATNAIVIELQASYRAFISLQASQG